MDDRHPCRAEEIGTPRDHTDGLYRVYFEVADPQGIARNILSGYSHAPLLELTHGYEATVHLQSIPDIAREIVSRNIALYQVVRYARVAP